MISAWISSCHFIYSLSLIKCCLLINTKQCCLFSESHLTLKSEYAPRVVFPTQPISSFNIMRWIWKENQSRPVQFRAVIPPKEATQAETQAPHCLKVNKSSLSTRTRKNGRDSWWGDRQQRRDRDRLCKQIKTIGKLCTRPRTIFQRVHENLWPTYCCWLQVNGMQVWMIGRWDVTSEVRRLKGAISTNSHPKHNFELWNDVF